MRIGILGGTFNPIHLGHIHLALEVRSRARLDEILFIPARIPPHKTEEELASPEDRYEMVRLAISGYPFFKISDIEMRRNKKSYSIDTIRELKQVCPEDQFFFVVGLDAFVEIDAWKECRALLQSVQFIVVSRPGFKFSDMTRLSFFRNCPVDSLKKLDEGVITELELEVMDFPKMILLHIKPQPVSASEIRKKIKKGDFENNFLPEAVKSFIIEKKVF